MAMAPGFCSLTRLSHILFSAAGVAWRVSWRGGEGMATCLGGSVTAGRGGKLAALSAREGAGGAKRVARNAARKCGDLLASQLAGIDMCKLAAALVGN